MIHRADCPYVQSHRSSKALPWQWADDQPEDIIAWTICRFGYRTCRHCRPMDENKLASWVFLGYLESLT